ncbi:MAG: hypothetical protein ABIZ36_10820 [Gemmatimonadaceae bacterium]
MFPSHVASLSLEVERKSSPYALDIAPIDASNGTFDGIRLSGGMCFYRDGRFYSECAGEVVSSVEFVPATGSIRMNVSGQYDKVPPAGLLSLVVKPIMQSFVLPFYHLKSLHAAVVARGDYTLMLTGAGGAGKSTTALRLMLDGYSLLSDDAPLFTYSDDRAFALSSLDCAHATTTTLDLLPSLHEGVIGDDHRGKFSISLARLQPNELWREPRLVTHFVHLVRRKVDRPRFIEADRSRATASLIGEAMTVFRGKAFAHEAMFEQHSRFSFDVVTSLVRDARVMALEFDDHHLDVLPKFLEQLT